MSDAPHNKSRALEARRFGAVSLHQNDAPLYKRAPTTDEDGNLLADFMMLIPKLNRCSSAELNAKLAGMQRALVAYKEVVFADLNLKLNVLWVSVKPRRGLIEEVALSIQAELPEAKLVSGEAHRRPS